MTTAELVSFYQTRTGNQVTDNQMRVLINEAQNEVFSINTYYNKKKPIASCTIDTEDTILQYFITDDLVRSVGRVYVVDGYGNKQDVAVEVDNAVQPGDDVTIYFKDNPGDTTGQIFYDAYLWPFNGQITSTSVPVSLPSKTHTGLLFFMVSKMLEVDKDGRSIYNEEEKAKWLRDWTTFANQGASPEPDIPADRGAV